MVTRGEVKTVIVAHKDRLVRFGAKFGCEILVVNKAEDMSPAQERLNKHSATFCGQALRPEDLQSAKADQNAKGGVKKRSRR